MLLCILGYSEAREKQLRGQLKVIGVLENKHDVLRWNNTEFPHFVLEGENKELRESSSYINKSEHFKWPNKNQVQVSEAHKIQNPSQSTKPTSRRNRHSRLVWFSWE